MPLTTSTPVSAGVSRQRVATKASVGAEHDRDEKREEAQLERRRQPVQHDREHVLAERDRRAEIALEHAAEPDDELLEDRLVEAVERAQPVDVRLRRAGRQHHRDRIARRDADDDEDDDRHAEERDQRRHAPREDPAKRGHCELQAKRAPSILAREARAETPRTRMEPGNPIA